MTSRPPGPARLWGRQYAFERNHLQRVMVLAGLVATFGVATILLVHTDATGVLGTSLVCGGLVAGLAAWSRARYVRETRTGYAVLARRDGRFVLTSAAGFVAVAGYVAVLVLR